MPKSTRNRGTRWTSDDERRLRELAFGNTPTRVIGMKLGRTEEGIRGKAHELGVSLRPTNQSPYGPRRRR